MCTVTYIPRGYNEFLLAANRDENLSRATATISIYTIGEDEVLLPVDPISKGSWIAVSTSNRAACVLNGAFRKHQHQPPYSRSRGLVLLDYFEWPGFSEFLDNYRFKGIEPFTMIVCEPGKLIEFRWDGKKAFTNHLNIDNACIWASSTLYSEKARSARKRWFREWLKKHPEPRLADQVHFHRHGGPEDLYNGLVMNRDNRVQTLSITGINKKSTYASLEHQDLIKHKTVKRRIDCSANETMESH